MGLDMYLDKVKRLNGATPRDVNVTEKYFGYLMRPSKYRDISMEEWCGVDQDEVNYDIADAYLREYGTRYWGWDDRKEYGHLGLWYGVGYWRKANHIHKWFVDNVQNGEDDCGTYEVARWQAEMLKDTCRKVISASELVDGKVSGGYLFQNGKEELVFEEGKVIADPGVAEELLPTTSGFFFGGTEYDEYYLKDVRYTYELMDKVLKEVDFDKEMLVYSSSW